MRPCAVALAGECKGSVRVDRRHDDRRLGMRRDVELDQPLHRDGMNGHLIAPGDPDLVGRGAPHGWFRQHDGVEHPGRASAARPCVTGTTGRARCSRTSRSNDGCTTTTARSTAPAKSASRRSIIGMPPTGTSSFGRVGAQAGAEARRGNDQQARAHLTGTLGGGGFRWIRERAAHPRDAAEKRWVTRVASARMPSTALVRFTRSGASGTNRTGISRISAFRRKQAREQDVVRVLVPEIDARVEYVDAPGSPARPTACR